MQKNNSENGSTFFGKKKRKNGINFTKFISFLVKLISGENDVVSSVTTNCTHGYIHKKRLKK